MTIEESLEIAKRMLKQAKLVPFEYDQTAVVMLARWIREESRGCE